ncbi:uncharacterized protein EV422DRAFT_564250 [Fimicolochytrium jonesii]|uniref:uncharacterized protein n=1 Tax=Fimicolochytrium jonesii TaxID=1396493 RepID=UPI0022FDCB9C|nr:uncharacterized protein EV422DRAFT_564250 [Fimicolochytrium jonesii]KAI8824891.1 hypothetical protein EV422DRAFT_564250 [Fimicolochytrium jonesii]
MKATLLVIASIAQSIVSIYAAPTPAGAVEAAGVKGNWANDFEKNDFDGKKIDFDFKKNDFDGKKPFYGYGKKGFLYEADVEEVQAAGYKDEHNIQKNSQHNAHKNSANQNQHHANQNTNKNAHNNLQEDHIEANQRNQILEKVNQENNFEKDHLNQNNKNHHNSAQKKDQNNNNYNNVKKHDQNRKDTLSSRLVRHLLRLITFFTSTRIPYPAEFNKKEVEAAAV